MKRTLWIGGILLIAIVVALFFLLPRVSSHQADPFEAVPVDAAVLVELPDVAANLQTFRGDTLWSLLQGYALPSRLEQHLGVFEDIMGDSLNGPLDELEMLVSLHGATPEDFGLLYIATLPAKAKREDWKERLEEAKTHKFSGVTIYEVEHGGENWAFATESGLLMASRYPSLVESAIDRLSGDGQEPTDIADLANIRKQTAKNKDAKLYFNFAQLPDFLSLFLGHSHAYLGEAVSGFASWAAMDLRGITQGLLLNGYLATGTENYLAQVTESPALQANLAQVLPFNTAVFYQINTLHLDRLVKSGESGEEVLNDYNRYFMNWAGNLVGLAIVEPFNERYAKECFVVMEAADTALAQQSLKELATKRQDVVEALPEKYKGYEIWELTDWDNLEATVGLRSGIMKDPYVSVIDEYVVFGNSIASLKVLLERYLEQQTLDQDLDYLTFKNQLTSNPAFYLFINSARCVQLLKGLANESFARTLTESVDHFQSLNPIGIQLTSYQDDMYLVNGLMQTYGKFQVSTDLLWKTELDTMVAVGPWVMINHDDDSREILVQDAHNNVYLISGAGEVFWDRQLDGPIVGEVHQVDYYKNGKLQYLLATKRSIHLIDRLGRFVENFPLRLPSEITSGVSVFDYNRNGEFRMFLGCANGNIYGFYKSGKPLPGWSPKRNVGRIEWPIQHFVADTRDYIVATNTEGTTYLFNRQAENRLGPYRTNANFAQKFQLEQLGARDFRLVNADTTGMVYYLNKNESIDQDSLYQGRGRVTFHYTDLDGDEQQEFIFMDAASLTVFNFERQELFTYPLPDRVKNQFFLLKGLPGYHQAVGFVTESDKIYLLGAGGDLADDFPLTGATRFVAGDFLNEGEQIVVTGLFDNTLTAYRLK